LKIGEKFAKMKTQYCRLESDVSLLLCVSFSFRFAFNSIPSNLLILENHSRIIIPNVVDYKLFWMQQHLMEKIFLRNVRFDLIAIRVGKDICQHDKHTQLRTQKSSWNWRNRIEHKPNVIQQRIRGCWPIANWDREA
jgi:hypothetical protein